MFAGVLEPNSTLTIPNQQIQAPIGTLTLTNNSNSGVTVVLRLNGNTPVNETIGANASISRGISDDSSVKNLGPGLIEWQFN
jgi:hypothetical protein